MKKVILSALVSIAYTSPVWAQDLPPEDAKAGECYAKVLVPATYENTPENIEIQPAIVNTEKVPAVYEDVEKRVLIQDESYELETIPAVYDSVSETVLIQPERIVKNIIPATYRTESKQILISPARVIWKAGRGSHEKVDSATGEIMCRVEIPAKYETVSQQIIDQPSSTQENVIPAKYMTIERRKMTSPPSASKKLIPAKYKTITVKELITPESFKEVVVPAKYSTISKRNLVTSEAVKWRQIMCETNTTPQFVMKLQKALVGSGYSIGTQPNGNFGPATKAAIAKFQLANSLPTGGLTLSTVKKLGL